MATKNTPTDPSYRIPTDFSRSFNPPTTVDSSVETAWVETDGRGYIVIKQLTVQDGNIHHIEEYQYSGQRYKQKTSYAATTTEQIQQYIQISANDIRRDGTVNPSFAN